MANFEFEVSDGYSENSTGEEPDDANLNDLEKQQRFYERHKRKRDAEEQLELLASMAAQPSALYQDRQTPEQLKHVENALNTLLVGHELLSEFLHSVFLRRLLLSSLFLVPRADSSFSLVRPTRCFVDDGSVYNFGTQVCSVFLDVESLYPTGSPADLPKRGKRMALTGFVFPSGEERTALLKDFPDRLGHLPLFASVDKTESLLADFKKASLGESVLTQEDREFSVEMLLAERLSDLTSLDALENHAKKLVVLGKEEGASAFHDRILSRLKQTESKLLTAREMAAVLEKQQREKEMTEVKLKYSVSPATNSDGQVSNSEEKKKLDEWLKDGEVKVSLFEKELKKASTCESLEELFVAIKTLK